MCVNYVPGLIRKASNGRSAPFWIGASDLDEEGKWKWLDQDKEVLLLKYIIITVGCKRIHPLGILPLDSIIGPAPKPSCHYTGSLCIIIKISQSYDSHS